MLQTPSHGKPSRAALFRLGRRFMRDRRATTAIEFAILGVPFFALICAILETALVFFASQIFDSAVQDASRLIRTGQAKDAGYSAASFKTSVCNGLYGLFDCSQIKLHTTVVSTFAAAGAISSTPTDPKTGDWNPDWVNDTYDGGVGSAVIMVEAYYKWPIIINFDAFTLQNTGDGKRMMAAVRVFRNEPF